MGDDMRPSIQTMLRQYALPLSLAGISLFCIAACILLFFKSVQSAEPIRFSSDEQEASGSGRVIVVDVGGAVAAAGVYTLPEGSRVGDALTAAGGLTESADTAWVEKTLNRADLLSDGAKLYIPNHTVQGDTLHGGTQREGLISVNTAAAGELDSLPGVGTVTAQKIIDNRPYLRLEELVEKKVLTGSVWEKVKGKITL